MTAPLTLAASPMSPREALSLIKMHVEVTLLNPEVNGAIDQHCLHAASPHHAQ